MKKIFFLAVIICSNHLVFAQERQDTATRSKDTVIQTTDAPNIKGKGTYIMMQAGQVLIVKEGKPVKLEKDKTLKDGTIITTDGKVRKTDGTTVQMKEGDKLYLDEGMLIDNKDPINK